MTPYKKKLIEVAIPLEAINTASAREKSIRHGHPSTLHLWWARRPLAACRAVLFAQLVDDPSGDVERLLADPGTRTAAERELRVRLEKREQARAAGTLLPAEDKPVTLEDVAVELERKRLFRIIEELVIWENSTNEPVLERARAEIRRCCGEELPPVYDPFSGGGSIPLEAQRLGLPAYGSDLNPVAVMIGKAMIEIPPKFKDREPIHPGGKARNHYRNAEGLAEDVKFYGEWMRERAFERIGHLYPKVDLPKEYGGGKATVIAWIWSRTVPSPDPALGGLPVPLVRSFDLSTKKGNEVWIEPVVQNGEYRFEIRSRRAGDRRGDLEGTIGRQGGICLVSRSAMPLKYVREQGRAGKMGERLMAIIAEGRRGRIYLPPTDEQEALARSAKPEYRPEARLPDNPRDFKTPNYGMKTFGDLFTDRQLVALNTFSDLVHEARKQIEQDALAAGCSNDPTPLRDGGTGARAYAEAVSVYFAFLVDQMGNNNSSICTWHSGNTQLRSVFSRQAIPMTWDFAESNVFCESSGSFHNLFDRMIKAFVSLAPTEVTGKSVQDDAAQVTFPVGAIISTDPPYYDNIGYADLSDFFFVWLKKNLIEVFPEIFGTIATPKSAELVATPYRHGGKNSAENFFLEGMIRVFTNIAASTTEEFPNIIYYAFKQSEVLQEGVASTGWATFLQAVVASGFSITGTWPIRTELATRMIASGSNALANSVVLVCRKKAADAGVISRAEFIRALKRELPPAIAELQAANIAPADMPQSAIGPGMGIFSRHRGVLEADDSPMTVKTALQLINRELDEYLGGIEGEFDADTRFAITWFEQFGTAKGDYGTANSIAQARGISVDSVKHAGIVESAGGKVRILVREELPDDWRPGTDVHLTVWECCQYLIRALETDGEPAAALLLKQLGPDKADAVKDLAYCLYDICSNKRKDAREATAYNALIAVWTELTRQAAAIHDTRTDRQTTLEL